MKSLPFVAVAKRLKRGTYRLCCGKCRSVLGYTPVTSVNEYIVRESSRGDYWNNPDIDPFTRHWRVEHRDGFWWDRETESYGVMHPNKRRRHRTPARLDKSVHHTTEYAYDGMDAEEVSRRFGYDLDFDRTPIGQFPALPAIIVCPRCSAPNQVDPPEDNPPPYIE